MILFKLIVIAALITSFPLMSMESDKFTSEFLWSAIQHTCREQVRMHGTSDLQQRLDIFEVSPESTLRIEGIIDPQVRFRRICVTLTKLNSVEGLELSMGTSFNIGDKKS